MGKNHLLEDLEDLVPDVVKDGMRTLGLTVASGVGAGALTALLGDNAKGAMLVGASVATITSFFSSVFSAFKLGSENYRTDFGDKLFNVYAVASLLGTISAFPYMGAKIGAGTHKLTTLALDRFKPEHQIEQVVDVKPLPEIDEIQIER